MSIFTAIKNWFIALKEADERNYAEIRKYEQSKGALLLLRNLEYKYLACFPSENFNEQEFDRALDKITNEDFMLLVMRSLNYRADAGSVLEFGIESSIEQRNNLIEYVLFKYLNKFKQLIVDMDVARRESFFNQLKAVQCPRILEQSVIKYELSINQNLNKEE